MRLPDSQAWVQPSVPCAVLRNRLGSLQRPMVGTLLGVAGRRPVQNCAWLLSPVPGRSYSARLTMASQRNRFKSQS